MTFADQEENDIEEVQDETTETGSEVNDESSDIESSDDESSDDESSDDESSDDESSDDESSDDESSDSDKAEEQPESCGDGCGCSDPADADIAADADAEIDAAAAAGDFPVASLEMLLMTHHTQAVMALGMMPDSMTGETSANKDAAKFHIDMLSVIEEKTKGNLTDEESEALNSILHQLRMAFFAS
jgi:hypothetical protein